MVRIPRRCPSCGREGHADIAASAHGGLRWSESFRCARCGAAFEADHGPDMPDAVRAALLAEHGTWSLDVEPAPRIAVGLRAVFGLSVAEAVSLTTRLPGSVATGTRAEVEALRDALARNGVSGRIRRIDA